MRSEIPLPCAALLHALLLFLSPCLGAEERSCEVAVAALSLPADSSGLVHWRDDDGATMPLQLSARYFSGRVKLRGGMIQFFDEPIMKDEDPASAPEPLVSMSIPPGAKLAYIVLWSETEADNPARWQGRLLNAKDWKAGSMKVFNACSEPLGIAAGRKRIQLSTGKSVDFHARDWDEPFPVKIFRLQPELKTVFSSTWRVTEERRELCFIGPANGTVTLRSLIALSERPPTDTP
ncbi:hypothetical protein [Haloferula sp. A504]|uniref:hypothetical protein n=1 Tax=Haloferula sp. A504 TaxID=3373601 RepID=UPI0031C34AE0|nr:hypothetical protein [Verrucomicrobiaceae bacterium E54]